MGSVSRLCLALLISAETLIPTPTATQGFYGGDWRALLTYLDPEASMPTIQKWRVLIQQATNPRGCWADTSIHSKLAGEDGSLRST